MLERFLAIYTTYLVRFHTMTTKHIFGAFYYVAKSYGIIPFNVKFRDKKLIAELSQFSTCWVIVAGSVFNLLNVWSLLKFIAPSISFDSTHETMTAVLILDSYSTILRNISMYLSIFVNRLNLVESINEVQRIWNKLQMCLKTTCFFDRDCRKMIYIQVLVTTIQLSYTSWLTYRYSTYDTNYTITSRLQWIVMMMFSLGLQAIVSVVHFTVFIIVVQLIRHINHKLMSCVKSVEDISRMNGRIRMQMFCNFSDEIDEMASFYNLITNFNARICRFFSVSMLAAMLNSFVFVMASVI